MNRFVYEETTDVWNVIVSENMALPSISEFFRMPLSGADSDTMDDFERVTGHRLYLGDTGAVIYYGDILPAEIADQFDVRTENGQFLTINGNTVSSEAGFAAVYTDGSRKLLWCNMDPTPFTDFPSNYVVTDQDGNVRRLGGVLIR